MKQSRVDFFQHDLGDAELRAVRQVLEGPILTTGETVALFERTFAGMLGRRYAVGVTSCTGALHLSLLAVGIGKGDEVITTPMTFIASATSIIEAGATPVFVDVEPDTGNMDAEQIEAAVTPRTRAILPVHLYGQMCDMRRIREIADRHSLKVVEDAAHCVEGDRDGIRPGELGDAACFSFYATKSLTCGEGGAVVTDDEEIAARVRLLRHHGMDSTAADRFGEEYRHWDMVEMGWKYNMDNIQAALLLPQFDRLAQKHRTRQSLIRAYEREIAGTAGVSWPSTRAGVHHAAHLFTIWVDPEVRDSYLTGLEGAGIGVAVNYRAIHLLRYFREAFGLQRGDFPVAERIGDSTVTLPLHSGMTEDHVRIVTAAVSDLAAARA